MLFCEHGFATDDNGCQLCVCIDAPPPAGAPPLMLPQPPPSPLPASCPEIMCRMACEHGYKTDDNGCQLCVCVDAPSPPPSPLPPSLLPPPPPSSPPSRSSSPSNSPPPSPPPLPSPSPSPPPPPLPSPPPPLPPSPLPPPPLPPPPSSQPLPPAAVVSLELVAAGSVDDFDPVRRTELRTRLATASGVAVEKVTLSVEAASVRLRFSVRVEAAESSVLAASLEAALPSSDAASAVLGVEVLTTPLLTLKAQPSPPPSEPLDLPPQPHLDPFSTSPPLEERASHVESGGGDDSSLALLLAGVGALVLAALLVMVAAVLFRRAKR